MRMQIVKRGIALGVLATTLTWSNSYIFAEENIYKGNGTGESVISGDIDNSTGEIKSETFEGTAKADVTAVIASSIKVKVPTSIDMTEVDKNADGSVNSEGTYKVSVIGDIASSKKVTVVPPSSVTMALKDDPLDAAEDVTATVSQTKTSWLTDEVSSSDWSVGETSGTVSATFKDKGTYEGTLTFTIKLEDK